MKNPRPYTLLLVDDDPLILDVLRIQLEQIMPDYIVIERASSGDEGLQLMKELAQEGVSPVEIIISDYFMPGFTGTDFLLRAHVVNPNSKKILLTGQADEATVNTILSETNLFHFMTKPWDGKELQQIVLGFIKEIE
jgi:two-component system, sensor histidine kinase and response regulator